MSISAGRRHTNISSYQNSSTLAKYQDQVHVARRTGKTASVWNSRTMPLGEVLHGQSTPVAVRDTSADRRDDPVVQRYIYVHSVSPSTFAVADGLQDAGCGLAPTGRRYAIPADHGGWFELLSQDGHAAAPFTSVHELMKAAPERCLIRRTIVGLAADDETGQWSYKIAAGETLSLEGVVGSAQTSAVRVKRCRCRVDRTGDAVLLAADQRGLFSPVAGPTNVAGVHRMRSIVAKFRLPVVVRLITRTGSNAGVTTKNDVSSDVNCAFRVIAVETEPAAFVVPLWNIVSPSDTNRKSLIMLPTSGQASSVLDGISKTTSGAPDWSPSGWNEMRSHCDDLIKSRTFTAEITRLFPTQTVNNLRRKSPAELLSPPPAAATDDYRLLREIDHIYEAIKTGDRKNGVRATTTRRPPRRYRSMRADTAAVVPFKGTVRARSPARRSNTLDPSYLKPQQLHSAPRPDSSPTRMRRMTSHATRPPTARRRSPPLQLHNEPIYDELRPMTSPPAVVKVTAGHVIDAENGGAPVPDNGPYIQPTNVRASAADNQRQVIKQNSTSQHLCRPRSFAGSGNTAWEMELCDDPTATKVGNNNAPHGPPLPAKRQQVNDNSTTLSATVAQSCLTDRSVSCSKLTSSSSDDVSGNRKSSSALGAMTNSLMRALRRTGSKSTGTRVQVSAVDGELRETPADGMEDSLEHAPFKVTDVLPVMPLSAASHVIVPEFGKVTHF